MGMRWRVTASEWQPNKSHVMDRDGAKIIDKEDNRRRLTANELNAQIGARGCLLFIHDLSRDMETQARHVGVWPRWKACIQQLMNMQGQMLDHTSLEQLLSIKNNTQRMKLSMTPEGLPSDPEMIIQPVKEWNRLLFAALTYCNMHCDGSAQCQHGCRIKKLLDNSPNVFAADFQPLVPGMCPYNMVDMDDWSEVRTE